MSAPSFLYHLNRKRSRWRARTKAYGFPPLFEINCALQYRASQTYEPSNRRIQPTQ